jgi:hypothetical protein
MAWKVDAEATKIFQKAFSRYDLDQSDLLESADELYGLVTNLAVKWRIKATPDEISQRCDTLDPSEVEVDIHTFVAFFTKNFAPPPRFSALCQHKAQQGLLLQSHKNQGEYDYDPPSYGKPFEKTPRDVKNLAEDGQNVHGTVEWWGLSPSGLEYGYVKHEDAAQGASHSTYSYRHKGHM